MKRPIDNLKPIDAKSGLLNVVIETPKGSRVKFAYEPDSGFFILSKALPEGMVFPFNFGFIPNTLAEDGDPLDVLVLNEEEAPLEFQSLKLTKRITAQVEFFFRSYNKLYGKKFVVLGTGGPHKAAALVKRAIELQRRKEKRRRQ